MLEARLARLREALSQQGADALLVTQPANVRYLSGFKNSEDGRILLTEADATLITDGRYIAQAAEESQLEVEIFSSSWVAHLSAKLSGERLAFEADHVSYDVFQTLSDKLSVSLVPSKGLVTDLRLIKSSQEIDTLRQVADLTDDAFTDILDFIQVGRSEVEVALELERSMRAQGAEGAAFPIIVASGVRSAMPHGTASSKKIRQGELVTLDFGAILDGYHADMTRTVAVGELSEEHQKLYAAVFAAQQAALDALGPGQTGREVDAAARDSLSSAGYGEYFSHSLGHGVGLEIHEGPRLAKTSEQVLKPGMTATIEPGAYIPGDAGVRIEDLTVITETGYERLSQSPKALLTL